MDFLDMDVVLALHDRQIADHGGLEGIRDEGLLESALARPQHRHAYGETDLYTLATAYAYGIARNHPFLDGNKRTAWGCARTFLRLNGVSLMPDRAQAVEIMVLLAEGRVDEAGFAEWLRRQPAP
jgi:death-on-curing protein